MLAGQMICGNRVCRHNNDKRCWRSSLPILSHEGKCLCEESLVTAVNRRSGITDEGGAGGSGKDWNYTCGVGETGKAD